MKLDKEKKEYLFDLLLTHIANNYVIPEKCFLIEKSFKSLCKKQTFARISNPEYFANKLTDILQEIAQDKHFAISYYEKPQKVDKEFEQERESELEKKRISEMESINFGVRQVLILESNVGYIDLVAFEEVNYAKKIISESMKKLSETDTLVIDLRDNGGGDPNTVAFLLSYIIESNIHVNSFFWRKDNRIERFYTSQISEKEKFGNNKPVYVLTSRDTFSAGEEFAYNIKQLKRGLIVGETTGGGAHPVEEFFLDEHFSICIPTGKAINPISNTNWEGIGVEPDIFAEKSQALEKVLYIKNCISFI